MSFIWQIFGKHVEVSPSHPEKQELFHLNSLAFTSFIFINGLFRASAEEFVLWDVSAVCAWLIHLKGLPFIGDVQKQGEGSHQGQKKEIWNVFSTFKYSKITSLGKNNGLFFPKAIWRQLVNLELPVHMTATSPFYLGVCSGGRRTLLSTQPEQPALGYLH